MQGELRFAVQPECGGAERAAIFRLEDGGWEKLPASRWDAGQGEVQADIRRLGTHVALLGPRAPDSSGGGPAARQPTPTKRTNSPRENESPGTSQSSHRAAGHSWWLNPAGNEEILAWINDLTSFGYRRPGTQAGLRAERYIERKFKEFGLKQVQLEPIGVQVWRRDKWSLVVDVDGPKRSVPCFPAPFTRFTPPEGVGAEMVYVGEGREDDYGRVQVKDKIVAVDIRFMPIPFDQLRARALFTLDPERTMRPGYSHPATWISPNREGAYRRAIRAGAAGVVGILKDMPASRCTLYAPYPKPQVAHLPLPMVYVGRDHGAELREQLTREGEAPAGSPSAPDEPPPVGESPRTAETAAGVRARLLYHGRIEPGVTHNVVGILPGKHFGNGAQDKAILISSHHDSPFAGAVEDGSGIAMVLALATYFAQVPRNQRNRTLWFVATAGHHYGSIGISTFLRQHARDLVPKLRCAIHLEHIGREFIERDGQLVGTGLPEPAAIFASSRPALVAAVKQAVIKHDLQRTLVLPAAGGERYLFALCLDGRRARCDKLELHSAGTLARREAAGWKTILTSRQTAPPDEQ